MGLGGLIKAPGHLISGALGFGGGATPQAQVQDFDADTKGLLEKQKARADETADQIVNRETAGADEKAQAFTDATNASKPLANAALGLNPMANDLDQALASRAQRQYADASGISKIRRKMDANNKMIKAQGDAAQAVNAQTKQKMESYSMQLKNQAAKKQARSHMLGSVLGMAGTVVGAIYGGPAGAAAGGAIGKGIGGSI